MNYRTYKFYGRKAITATTTIVEDLRLVDAISEIIIGLECTNDAGTQVAHPVACLSKVEIVDGSEVLYSLDGYEAEALDWYNAGGKFRSNWNFALPADAECRYLGIPFGRYLYDPQYALDPKKFVNPQIRVTVDPTAGGDGSGTAYITMWANLFDEKSVSPSGFLMAKEIKRWTIASAVHEYTDMPTDYPYRGIYLRAYAAGTEPNQVIANIKLSEDQDKRIPYDLGAQDLLRCVQQKYPDVEEHYYFGVGTSNAYLYVAPTERVAAVASPWGTTAVANSITLYDGDGGRLKTIASAAMNAQIYVRGNTPHAVYEIPCGNKEDPGDWYNVRSIGNLRLDVLGAASGAGYLYLQQLRTY